MLRQRTSRFPYATALKVWDYQEFPRSHSHSPERPCLCLSQGMTQHDFPVETRQSIIGAIGGSLPWPWEDVPLPSSSSPSIFKHDSTQKNLRHVRHLHSTGDPSAASRLPSFNQVSEGQLLCFGWFIAVGIQAQDQNVPAADTRTLRTKRPT